MMGRGSDNAADRPTGHHNLDADKATELIHEDAKKANVREHGANRENV